MSRAWRSVVVVLVLLAVGPVGAVEEEAPPELPAAPALGPGWIGAPPPEERIVLPEALRAKASSTALVDACVRAAMRRHGTPGAAVAVVDGGEVVFESGFGVKRRGEDDPVGPDTLFRIGSVTKQLTAAAVLQQVDAGAVSLSDPVTRHVPELALDERFSADRLAVRHLLTHTAGYPDNFVDVVGPVGPEALTNWVASQQGIELHAPPGRFWNYSNPNFSLAGLVVERASGLPYHEYMAERVFAPAGLARTTLLPAEVVADGDWAWGHLQDPVSGQETVYRPDDYDSWAFAPAGYAFSTAGDLARWALLLIDGGGGVLSPQSAAAMQAAHVAIPSWPLNWYGYGVFRERYRGLELQHHGGNIPGWGTYLLWLPDRRAAVAGLANTFESLNDAAYCIVDNVFGTPGEPAPDLSPDPSRWPGFVGEYEGLDAVGNPVVMEISLEGSSLQCELYDLRDPGDRLEVPMTAAFWDTFVVDLDGDGVFDLDLTFHTDPGTPGRVSFLVNRVWVGARREAPRAAGGRLP